MLKPRKETPRYIQVAGVIIKSGRVLLSKRPSKGLLGGMWEFPNGRVDEKPAEGIESALEAGYRLKVKGGEALGVVRHAYTHFRVTVHAYHCELVSMSENEHLKWVKLKELDNYPMGKVDRQIARMLDG